MLALAVAATSAAAPLVPASRAAALPGPTTLFTGFDADTLAFGDGETGAVFSAMRGLDSSWVRIPVSWNAIAPAHRPRGFRADDPGAPGYNWPVLDGMVKDAVASGQQVLLTLQSPPSWALGPGAPRSAWPDTWRPDPSAYGAFAHAVAERYSGRFPDPSKPRTALPLVSHFQAWNEPNLRTHLTPQWTRTRHGFVPASPAVYRGLLNALYAAVKSVQPHAFVLAAGLAPYGDPPGVDRMHPVVFLRELLCLQGAALRAEKCPDPAHFDAIDIHPYGLTPTIHAFSPDDVSVPDIGRLSSVLRAAGRAGRALPRGSKAIWMTEISWDTKPPDALGIPLDVQARYVSLTFYELWHQGVNHVHWYEPRDLGVPAKSFTGAGLFFHDGQPKPSANAFRFPFVALRDSHGMATLWGRAPSAGSVTIEVASGHGWRQLARLTPTSGGVFYTRRRVGARLTLRARVGTIASNPWSTA